MDIASSRPSQLRACTCDPGHASVPKLTRVDKLSRPPGTHAKPNDESVPSRATDTPPTDAMQIETSLRRGPPGGAWCRCGSGSDLFEEPADQGAKPITQNYESALNALPGLLSAVRPTPAAIHVDLEPSESRTQLVELSDHRFGAVATELRAHTTDV